MTITPELEILICAPNGCADASALLEALSDFDLSDKTITILEFGPNCTQTNNLKLPKEKVEHRHFEEFGDMGMRQQSFLSSKAAWMAYLEDHALPDTDFFSELVAYLKQEFPADAITFYSKNGTPNVSVSSRWLVILKALPALAAVVPSAVPVPAPLVLSCAVATTIRGVVPGSAGV